MNFMGCCFYVWYWEGGGTVGCWCGFENFFFWGGEAILENVQHFLQWYKTSQTCLDLHTLRLLFSNFFFRGGTPGPPFVSFYASLFFTF